MSCGVLDCMPNNAPSGEADKEQRLSSSGSGDAEPVVNSVDSMRSGGLTQIRGKLVGLFGSL
jgi:hypothetical protein